MCWTRGGRTDYDAWVALGNPGWGWDDLLPTSNEPRTTLMMSMLPSPTSYMCTPNASTHGTTGYIDVSYPKYFYPQSRETVPGWTSGARNSTLLDPNNGTTTGGMLIPNSLSPDSQTRSDARSGYYDGFVNRSNLHVATGQVVIRVLVDSPQEVLARDLPAGQFITGVQILELSGIGQPAILEELGLPVHINLPGLERISKTILTYPNIFQTDNNQRLLTQAEQEYYANKTAAAENQGITDHLVPGLDASVISGYAAQKDLIVKLLNRSDVSAYELLNDNMGLLSVAAMHPLSRGSVHITTDNPYVPPDIDPRYCSNPLDLQILTDALMFNNELVNTNSIRLLQPKPYYPFLPDATPESLIAAINSGLRTEFHGSGSTSMMPREMGGVVDPDLRVYGTKNLRIVDAGIIPILPASHLQAPIYAIAEKAADTIKRDNYGLHSNGCGKGSTFARPGPVLSNLSINSLKLSASNLLPSATMPQVVSSSPLASPSFLSSLQIISPPTGFSGPGPQVEKISTLSPVSNLKSPALRGSAAFPTLQGWNDSCQSLVHELGTTVVGTPIRNSKAQSTARILSVGANIGSPALRNGSEDALMPSGIATIDFAPAPALHAKISATVSVVPASNLPAIATSQLLNSSEVSQPTTTNHGTRTPMLDAVTSTSPVIISTANLPSVQIMQLSMSSQTSQLTITGQNALADVAAVFGAKFEHVASTAVPIPVAGAYIPGPTITSFASVLDILPPALKFKTLEGSDFHMVASMLEVKYAIASTKPLDD
ncbi:hypothetical protein DID88_005309 [Monilinia fructigena]|nr:hypothetical protein DID88_005309 [Monilinia fructigena]